MSADAAQRDIGDEVVTQEQRQQWDAGAELLFKADDELERHSEAARDAFREWRGQFQFEEKDIPEFQKDLRGLLSPYPTVAEIFSVFLNADTSTEEAAASAKRDFCALTGMITIKVPPGTRQRLQIQTKATVAWMRELENRATERSSPELAEQVQQEMLGVFHDKSSAAREQRLLRIEALLSEEPDLLAGFKEATGSRV